MKLDHINLKLAWIVQRLDLPIESEDAILRNAIDSLEFVEFIMEVEREFKIEISHAQAAQLTTLKEFSEFVFNATN